MKKYLIVTLLLLTAVLLLASCGCTEHIDSDGDGLCDSCREEMPEGSTGGTTAATGVTTTASPPELPEDAALAAAVEAVIGGAYFGAEFDIGLTAETAPYYSVRGEDGFVTLNEEGKLEFIGIRALTAPFELIGPQGQTVYGGFYSLGQTQLAAAIRTALYREGLIARQTADAPASVLSNLQELSLEGVSVEQ